MTPEHPSHPDLPSTHLLPAPLPFSLRASCCLYHLQVMLMCEVYGYLCWEKRSALRTQLFFLIRSHLNLMQGLYFLSGINDIIALSPPILKFLLISSFGLSLASLTALESLQGLLLRFSEPLQVSLKIDLTSTELQ